MKIKGTVWEPVQAAPRSAAFGRLAAGAIGTAKGTKKITITNNVKGELKLANIKSTNPAFAFEIKEIEPGQKAELTIKIVGALKPGLNRANIEMSTGIAEMPKLKITTSAHLTPEVEVQPKQVTIYPDRKTRRPYTVIVRNNGKSPLKVSDVVINRSELKVSLIEKKPGKMFSISLDIPAEFKLTGKEEITFKTDNPLFPTMSVPVVEKKMRSRTTGKTRNVKKVSKAEALGGKDITRRKRSADTQSLSADQAATAATADKKGKNSQKGVSVSPKQTAPTGRGVSASNKIKRVTPGIKKAGRSLSPTANRNGTAAKPEAEAEAEVKDDGEKAKKEESTSADEPKKKEEAGDK